MHAFFFRSLVITAVFCGSLADLSARLGEGPPQLEKRYGSPVNYIKNKKKFIFKENGFEIQVILNAFQADVMIYLKPDKSGKPHGKITEQERDAFMKLNAEGQSWEQVNENDDYALWRSSDGRCTTWHKKHKVLIIETSVSYTRRNQKAEMAEDMQKEPVSKTISTGENTITVKGEISQAELKKILSKFVGHFIQFPKAYWYAADAMLNKANGTTFYDDPETFQKDYHIEDLNLKVYTKNLVASFKLIDSTEPDQFYEFEFRKDGDKPWEPLTGFNVNAQKGDDSSSRKGIDLYKAGFASPSMKPFVAKEVADMQAKRGKFAPLPKPKIEAPIYQTLDGEGLSGSGFHFEAMGKRYIACSLHQFDNRIPKHMLWNVDLDKEGTGEKPIKVVNQAYKRSDVQILSYEDKKLDQVKPLKLGNKEPVSWGHPVYLYGHEKPVLAHVFTYRDLRAKVIPSEPFMATARSGSPVVSANTCKIPPSDRRVRPYLTELSSEHLLIKLR